jgi:hypothetical protein
MTAHATTEAIVTIVGLVVVVVDALFTEDAPTPLDDGVDVCCAKLGVGLGLKLGVALGASVAAGVGLRDGVNVDGTCVDKIVSLILLGVGVEREVGGADNIENIDMVGTIVGGILLFIVGALENTPQLIPAIIVGRGAIMGVGNNVGRAVGA